MRHGVDGFRDPVLDAGSGEESDDDDDGLTIVAPAEPRELYEAERLEAVHAFLHKMGDVLEAVPTSGYAKLVVYLQGRLH